MTIDEAIKHYEELAERKQKEGFFRNTRANAPTVEGSKCYECASEYRQMAEWLEELKAYRETEKYKWNNHQVACLLADIFGDTCACNYNGIDEWLPFKCELLDACPNTVGVACWEQYLTHREVNTDADSD